MKARFTVAGLAVLAALVALPALAADGMKIGLLDLKRCVSDSKKGAKIAAEFKAKTEEIDKRLAKIDDEVQKITQEAERQGALMSEAAREEKRKRFLSLRDEANDLRASRRKAGDDLSEAVLVDLQKIITQFGEEQGYDLILTTGGPWLAYARKTTDVTGEVIRRYNQATEGK